LPSYGLDPPADSTAALALSDRRASSSVDGGRAITGVAPHGPARARRKGLKLARCKNQNHRASAQESGVGNFNPRWLVYSALTANSSSRAASGSCYEGIVPNGSQLEPDPYGLTVDELLGLLARQ
jgi:hypothetical protein